MKRPVHIGYDCPTTAPFYHLWWGGVVLDFECTSEYTYNMTTHTYNINITRRTQLSKWRRNLNLIYILYRDPP